MDVEFKAEDKLSGATSWDVDDVGDNLPQQQFKTISRRTGEKNSAPASNKSLRRAGTRYIAH